MKAILVYDSYFGNTEKIALSIAEGMEGQTEVINIRDESTDSDNIQIPDMAIIGSPTRGFRATQEINNFIKSQKVKNIPAAAFDTRVDLEVINSKALRFLVKKGGYAADTINSKLIKKGCEIIMPPEGFIVMGEEGPLKNGELERAYLWGKKITSIFREKYLNR
jgi:flavodoxin